MCVEQTQDDDKGRLVAKLCDLSSAAPLADTLPHSGRNPNPAGGGGGGGGGAGGAAPPAAEAAEEAAKDEFAGALKWGADIVLHAVRQLGSSPSSNQWMPVGTLAWMAPEMMSQHYEVHTRPSHTHCIVHVCGIRPVRVSASTSIRSVAPGEARFHREAFSGGRVECTGN